jgi:MFS family permease
MDRTAGGEAPEQRRILAILVAAQVLSGAGLAAGVTVGALLAQDMLGSTSLAGVPIALFTLGSAAAAVSVGRLSQRSGRRAGLAAGYLAGALGSVGVVLAALADSVPALFLALFVYGAGAATNLQARYAGADLASPSRRARAVATVLVATTLGAVVGPNLVGVMGEVARTWGIPPLAGPFLLAAAAYGAAGIVLAVFLRPDPLLLARSRAAAAHQEGPALAVPIAPRRWSGAVALGAAVMVVSQLVMIAIMTMTPVHLTGHGHDVTAAGVVIAVHVGAMYLPSPLSGWLVDRLGAPVVAGLAALTLLSAGASAALAPTRSVPALAVALALLGLGWSLGLVSGTAIVTASVPLETRARTQGGVDVLIALAGATGGAISGVVVAGTSYAALALGGGVLALALLPLVARTRRSTRLGLLTPSGS